MKILITGGSGFVGRALILKLIDKHELFVLTHQKTHELSLPKAVRVFTLEDKLPNVDAIVNLAGASISEKRLTKKRLNFLLESRLNILKHLDMQYQNRFPLLFIQASATGIYENGFNLDEDSKLADTIYARLCIKLEQSANRLCEKHHIKLTTTRIGVVIGKAGGLKRILEYLPRIYFINGTNLIPSITIEDCANAFCFILENKLTGIINLCSDKSLSLNKLMQECSNTSITLPSLKLFLNFDRRGDLLLANQDLKPKVLLQKKFKFLYK